MRRPLLSLAILAVFASAALPAAADDVLDQINEAVEAYKRNDLDTALSGLDAAGTLIRQKRASAITALLPPALSGWETDPEPSEYAANAAYGGGVGAERRYHKLTAPPAGSAAPATAKAEPPAGEQQPAPVPEGEEAPEVEVTISIVADSPVVQSVAMMFGNPMFMGGGRKLVVINGRKAIEDREQNSLQTLVASRALVTVQGSDSDPATIEAVKTYFKSIDFAKIDKALR